MTAVENPVAALAVSQLEPAGFWIRAGARLVDWIVFAFVGLVVGLVLLVIAGIVEGLTGRPADEMLASMQKTTFIGWIGGALTAIAYHACFEGVAGSTVGKRLMRLQVVSMDGGAIRFAQAWKRSVAFLLDALFFGGIAALIMDGSPEKRRAGDNWADTRVVRRRSLPMNERTPTARMFFGLALAVIVAGGFTALTQLLEYLWFLRSA